MPRKNKTQDQPQLSFFRREVLAILFSGAGVFVFLSLLSYHPSDPSFLNVSASHTLNWGGVAGAYLADTLLFVIGAASYLMGFFLILIGLHFFIGTRHSFALSEIPLFLSFLVLAAIFFDMIVEKITFSETTIEAGGIIGDSLAGIGIAFLGRPGTYLIALLGALLAFAWATNISIKKLGIWMYQIAVSFVLKTVQKARIFYARLQKFLEKNRSQREARESEKLGASVQEQHEEDSEVEDDDKNDEDHEKPKEVVLNPFSKVARPQASQIALARPRLEPAPVKAEPLLQPRIAARAEPKKSAVETRQMSFGELKHGYQLPPLTLLDAEQVKPTPVDEDSLKANARLLEKKLLDFNVEGAVTEIHPGPVITMYEFQPAPGVKLSRIANLSDDLGLAMGGKSVRIVSPLPNKPAVGIEIPNAERETVYLKDIIACDGFQKIDSRIPVALGKDIEGIPYVGDLSKMPHLLVAGATGAGKSVSINATILSFLYKSSPEDVRLILVDPKMLELSIYEGIPHLLLPVVTEPKKASLALRWAVREMERRYRHMADINARNIINYNQKLEKENYVSRQAEKIKEMGAQIFAEEDQVRHDGKLPYIVIIIDELADLMMVAGRDVEESITRLAQMARAAGIHLILATQRPSVDVITGVIKANFPSRIAFKVSSKHDARTVMDSMGAERLLGNGDMLFVPPGAARTLRVHGAFISETEVSRVVDFLKKQGKPVYDETILKPIEAEEGVDAAGDGDDDADDLYDQAVSIVSETKQASISMIQRRLRVGYNRAARMIERMESQGIVSPPSGSGQRQVMVGTFGDNP